MKIKDRIRGYLPVVVDIETGGFNDKTDAMLEICAIIIGIDDKGVYYPKDSRHFHIEPFKGANLDPSALKFNGIDVNNPFRMAVSEKEALGEIFKTARAEMKEEECTRAILVGHNAFFDLGFLYAASNRSKLKNPFHQFSTIDTVSLSALYYGETVLAKAMRVANIEWDDAKAHSALYDTKKTAELFCKIFNAQDYT
ncbi:MAG: ribonuclease T [Candidatus Thioglobus sp.]|jgi:ribonuclease T|uniref:ribonuclease T n=1 Tax=Candidatus Thioglobus sp. TaxID=2026721 RepID=UPI0001BD392F|nr:ribonuclease T [Candidatus Thioglobus sp.]EEZ79647.1 MAG: DNA polymerase III, epsilon subunit [uncultured Candidatus Thioglobus sp.]MBT3186851.1 ribonuclease T [Candidatus Thioglobus sp.]MBT3431738.1 ribonuclease T [Candidatus Thioglobus sp.]MBT5287398.1 ribonuclease T [Candidatus Thioglobus sp.]MBT6327253.1 ribonuclease T [Candidatus Thioglobus sp.]